MNTISFFFSSKNFNYFVVFFIAFLVLSSKHIIIYNEEILVVFTFLMFLYTCQKMAGDSIESSLNERSHLIATELRTFLTLKKELVQEVLEDHKKQALIKAFLKKLGEYSRTQILQIASKRKSALRSLFLNQIQRKLRILAYYGQAGPMSRKIQTAIAASFRGAVLLHYLRSKNKLKRKVVKRTKSVLRKKLV